MLRALKGLNIYRVRKQNLEYSCIIINDSIIKQDFKINKIRR